MTEEDKAKKIVKQTASAITQSVAPKEVGKRSMIPSMILHVVTVSILIYILLRLSSIEIRLDRINNFIAKGGGDASSKDSIPKMTPNSDDGPSCPFSMSYLKKKILPSTSAPSAKSKSEMVDIMSRAIQEANQPDSSQIQSESNRDKELPPSKEITALEEIVEEEEEDIPE